MEASTSLPSFCIIFNCTTSSISWTLFHTLFQINIFEFSLAKIFTLGIGTVILLLLIRCTSSKPNTVSPWTTTLHSFFLRALSIALFVWFITVSSHNISTKAMRTSLHWNEFKFSISSHFKALFWRSVCRKISCQISLVFIFKTS